MDVRIVVIHKNYRYVQMTVYKVDKLNINKLFNSL